MAAVLDGVWVAVEVTVWIEGGVLVAFSRVLEGVDAVDDDAVDWVFVEEDDEVFEMFCDVELLVGGLVAEDEVLLGGVAEVVVAGAEVEVLVEVVVIVEADVEVVLVEFAKWI